MFSRSHHPYLLLVLTMLFWSGNMLLGRAIRAGVSPLVLAFWHNCAVGEVGAGRASLFIHLMPVFGTLLSVLFLGEIPRAYHYAGIALIFAGIYLTTAALPRLQPAK